MKKRIWMTGNRKRCSRLLLMVLCVGLLLSGCSQAEREVATAAEEEPQAVQIGLSFDSFVIERWIRDRDVFVSAAKELGAEVNVQNANGDVKEQIAQIEYLIQKQVDVIVIVTGDQMALSDVMRQAKEAGIKTLCYDRLIRNADCDLYISFDNEQVGILMGESLIENLPEGGDVFLIQGPETDGNVGEIRKGLKKTLAGTNLQIVYEANCEGWLAEHAFTYVKEALKRYPEVKAVVCGNDDLATQAFRALSEERLAGRVVLTGQDGDLIACQRIVEGTQEMTAFKSLNQEAQLAACYAVMLAEDEPMDEVTETIGDGTYQVPYLELEPIAVTRENMDEVIIRGGFHAEEDVYRNVREQRGSTESGDAE